MHTISIRVGKAMDLYDPWLCTELSCAICEFPLGRPNRQPSHGIMLKGESLACMAFVGSMPYVNFGFSLLVLMTFLTNASSVKRRL